jgi:hypothetical protein
MARDLPCHAKVMALPGSRNTLFWGTDPWEFAELSQINGNDCYFMPNFRRGPWESRWQIQNMYYDLQRSMKSVPVFNSENHIIADRTQDFVASSHIYTAIWQGAIHGQGGSTTWAWQRSYDRTSDFEGLILHRAACTAAMSRCALDLMRLSREVAALQNVPARVALLYSHAAMIHDARAMAYRSRVYEALNFTGLPIGFVTDEQVAAGWLDRYDCLIVAGARASTREALDAIRAYQDAGGHVVAYGEGALAMDEYGRSVVPVTPDATVNASLEGSKLRDALLRELKRAGVEPEYLLKTPWRKMPYGAEWRSATIDGRSVLNLVNLTQEPLTVRLPKGDWQDLITGRPLGGRVQLETNVPVLAGR